MLIIGETFNQRKAFLWSCIHTCQELVNVLQKIKGDNRALALSVIKQQREIIKSDYAALKELQKWFKQSGMDEDEGYVPPLEKARWNALTEEEKWAEEEHKLEIAMKILAIKERNGWE